MYRTLAWHCLQKKIDVHDAKAVAALCRRWKTTLECVDRQVRLLVERLLSGKGNPHRRRERGRARTSPPCPPVRQWMKHKQRECLRFGNLVMEGRDIGTNVFPETDFKFYLDASLEPSAPSAGPPRACGKTWPPATSATASGPPRR